MDAAAKLTRPPSLTRTSPSHRKMRCEEGFRDIEMEDLACKLCCVVMTSSRLRDHFADGHRIVWSNFSLDAVLPRCHGHVYFNNYQWVSWLRATTGHWTTRLKTWAPSALSRVQLPQAVRHYAGGASAARGNRLCTSADCGEEPLRATVSSAPQRP